MAGLKRVLGWLRALSSGWVAAGLLGAVICITASCTLAPQGDPPSLPVGSVGGGGDIIGPPSFGGTEAPCLAEPTQTPVFAGQVFGPGTLFGRELYTWATTEDALALRSARDLFSAPAGSDLALASLSTLGSSTQGDESMLAQALLGVFQDGRYAWPEPWAIRLGGASQSPGDQLVHITLKSEAWLALVAAGHLFVYDASMKPVTTADALAHPENVGVIYFDSTLEHVDVCVGGSGQREFLLGNLAMVEEWSIGTQRIADRLSANIDELTRFLNGTRSCPVTADANTWGQSVLCSWVSQADVGLGAAGAPSFDSGVGGASSNTGQAAFAGFNSGAGGAVSSAGASAGSFDPTRLRGFVGPSTEEAAYEQALAIPSASYLGAPAQIATIIETLQGDLFEPDPLVVTPGSP